MLKINRLDFNTNGGILSALSQKSEDFIRDLLKEDGAVNGLDGKEKYLDRIIVHTDPHIDEYFAQLLFRAMLPPSVGASKLDYQEVSIISKDDDLNCKSLFPSSAVFGIGGEVSGGADALFIFDEHLSKQRTDETASCSQIVVQKFVKKTPQPIYTVLREINAIDQYGMAHPQHLGNIIKQLWNAKFIVSNDGTWCTLTPKWKRSIIDACLTAIIYCLYKDTDIFGHINEQIDVFKQYSEFCIAINHHKEDIYFKKFSIYGYSKNDIFKQDNAFLRTKNGEFLLNKASNRIPQLLMVQRICYACHHCWGENITKIIMLHVIDMLIQQRIQFVMSQNELVSALKNKGDLFRTKSGFIERRILPKIQITTGDNEKADSELIILHFAPIGFESHTEAKKAAQNYMTQFYNGCGILLMENTTTLTKALFAGKNISKHPGWDKIVNEIMAKEPEGWHKPAPDHILNGNKAHLYRPRSKLDVDSLEMLVKKAFY